MQAAVHFRATLAARLPEARPLLAALCEPIGCALEPPRQIDLIEIESSDLTPDPQTPGRPKTGSLPLGGAGAKHRWGL